MIRLDELIWYVSGTVRRRPLYLDFVFYLSSALFQRSWQDDPATT
jgi:hypothetical protein